MKRLYLFLTALFIAGTALFNTASATHIMGMNISYVHLQGDTYEITLDFWRYCGGSAFNGTPTYASTGVPTSYSIYCPDVGFQVSRPATFDTLIDVSPICDSLALSQNSCIAGYTTGLLGIEWTIMKDTLVLSDLATSTCSEFLLVYGSGARNTGVNYLTQPSIAAYTTLMEQTYPNNSSPLFTTDKPIPFFCDGQEVTYNWGIVEQDGDSLYWELDTAIQTYSTITGWNYITYAGAWNGLVPMNGVTIDNATGQLDFVAYKPPTSIAANYAIAVKVSEYDSETGDLKNVTQRDVQFIVMDSCENIAPQQDPIGLMNFSGSGAVIDSNTVEVCVGQSFAFDVVVYDLDTSGNYSSDSIDIQCNIDQVLPGAVWTSNGTNPDTISISWNAVPVSQTFVPFNITVTDDACPVTGFNIYNYNIFIVPSTFLGPDTAICSLDTISLDANGGDTFTWSVLAGDPITVGQNFGCSDCPDPWIHPSQTTTYVVESNLSATCGNKDTITVTVFNQFPVDITPVHGGTVDTVVYCSTDPLDTLIAQSPGGTYLGPGIVNAVDGVFAPDILDPGFGNDSTVTITYVKQGVCANTSTLAIRVKGLPDARILTEGPFCKFSTSEQLVGYSPGGTWAGPNITTGGVFDPSQYAASAPDTVLIHHTVDDSGCVFTDSAYFRIINEYSSAIDSLPKICAGEDVLIYLNDYEGDPFGTWTGKDVFEEPSGSGQFYFEAEAIRAGGYDITYTIDGDCGTTTTKQLDVNPLPDAEIFGADSVYCDNISDSVLLEAATPNGIWGGTMNELHDGYFVPSRLGEGLYTISYELYDTVTTCYNKNVVPVRIARTPVRPKIHGGGPYCQGDHWRLRGDGLLSNTYKWYEVSLSDTLDTALLGAGNPFDYGELVHMPSLIYGTQVSEYGCESRKSRLVVEVKPSPFALIGVDTLNSEDLKAAGAGNISGNVPLEVTFHNLSGPDTSDLTYTWVFDQYDEFFETEGESQEFTFEDIGRYTVILVADNGQCLDSTQLDVILNRTTAFFIPNVFTPNGDASNDFFEWEIVGIDEFEIKIYNRWGTKVFQTTDITEFWDGGKEPEGTYYYVVTGREQTLTAEEVEWRGDLTLLRE